MSKKNKGLGKFFVGAALGAGLGVLFAPKSGKDTRKEVKDKIDDMIAKIKELDKDEVKEEFEIKLYRLKTEIENLDKETVMKTAKKKAKEVQDMAEELVDYAVEKGTPVLEKAASSIREKALAVTKEVVTKLEKAEESK